jgi:hypothetical protein
MNNQLISSAYTTFINKGAFALLLGSGISRKAGIPTGWDVTLNLVQQIALLHKETISTTPEEWYVNRFKEDLDYSKLLEKLTTTQEERINLLKPFIEPTEDEFNEGLKRPTKAHEQIAQLVRLGYIKVILTTNFDRLIENALKDIGIEPTIISNPRHIENSIPLIHSNITVIKINGDYLDTGFLNLKSELEEYDPDLEKLMNTVFENFGLITCGWSAKWDIALVNSLKSSNKFRFSNFFTHLNEPEIELSDLAEFRKGHLIPISNADNFFSELYEDILALETNNHQHPLSPKIALARLKKYVVKEEHIISIHELLSNISDEALSGIGSVPFPNPDMAGMNKVMNLYLQHLETLSLLLAEGVYWAKSYHDKIWVDIVKKTGNIDHEQNRTGSYAVWSDIQYLPCLISRYIVGVAAVSSKNFNLLNSLLKVELHERYDSKNIIEKTNPWDVIKSGHLNKMLSKKHHTPMSEVLYEYVRPYFKQVIPIDKEFDEIFDYYEFICAIVFVKNSKDNDKGWGPIGRFAYRDKKISQRKLDHAKESNENFELVSAGIFDSYSEFEEVVKLFDPFLKNLNSRW